MRSMSLAGLTTRSGTAQIFGFQRSNSQTYGLFYRLPTSLEGVFMSLSHKDLALFEVRRVRCDPQLVSGRGASISIVSATEPLSFWTDVTAFLIHPQI